jgi:polyisoprenoid-binding protein YceI
MRLITAALLSSALTLPGPLATRADETPPAPRLLAVTAPSSVSYRLDHTLHEVVGISKRVEGTVTLQPGGTVEAELRVRVDSFDSGNSSRDAKVLEVTDATRHPVVVVTVSGPFTPPTTFPSTVDVTLSGALSFHGRSRPLQVPTRVTFTAPDTATVAASFAISLEAFQVEPPSLLFLSIKDRAVIEASLTLAAAGPER